MELSGKTLRAYTRQHPQVLKTLEQTGVYRAQKSHIEEKNGAISQYYLELYDWYVRHAERLVPRPEGAEYPIWLFPAAVPNESGSSMPHRQMSRVRHTERIKTRFRFFSFCMMYLFCFFGRSL